MANIVIPFNPGGRSGIYPATAIIHPVVGLSVGGKSGVNFQTQIISPLDLKMPATAGGLSGANLTPITIQPLTVRAPFTCGSRSGADFGMQVSYPAAQVTYNAPVGGLSGASMGIVVHTPLAIVIPFVAGGLSGAELFPAQTEDYETWVLNDNSFAPSAYTDWPFNSYAQYHGQYYAAGNAGLYLLGGPDQDGAEIHAGVRLSRVNFGTDRQKRLRSMRLGATGDRVLVRLATDRGERIFALRGVKVPVSRDVQGKEWTIDISDFSELSFIEIVPLILVN
jgi:hypothetical protein